MGLEEIFTTNANFSRLIETDTPSLGLYVGKMLHKARIEINEEGSEAAAATGKKFFKSVGVRLVICFFYVFS